MQVRYSDGSAQAWDERVAAIDAGPGARVGAALHSVRAVPRDALEHVARTHHDVLHVHLSEQVAENEACQEAYGVTPTRLLAAHGLLRPTTTLVHATHLTPADITLIGEAGAYVDFCPTTERDLGDGVGPSRHLADAGARLTLGSDSHAVIDLFEEMRAVELDERLATMRRGHWSAAELLTAATTTGHASLGLERTPARSRWDGAPTWSPSTWPRRARPVRAPTSTPWSSRRAPATSCRWSPTASSSTPATRSARSAASSTA